MKRVIVECFIILISFFACSNILTPTIEKKAIVNKMANESAKVVLGSFVEGTSDHEYYSGVLRKNGPMEMLEQVSQGSGLSPEFREITLGIVCNLSLADESGWMDNAKSLNQALIQRLEKYNHQKMEELIGLNPRFLRGFLET